MAGHLTRPGHRDVPARPAPRVPSLPVRELAVTPDLIRTAAETLSRAATRPGRGFPTDRAHGRYRRALADLPRQGRRVVARLTARRLRCPTPGCPRAAFRARAGGAASRHARATDRPAATHRAIGFALGGQAGGRLARHPAAPASPDPRPRRVTAAPGPARPTPRVPGAGNFAFHRGQTYGTILLDLERRRGADLPPDRAAEAPAGWLRAHPGVAAVRRGRAPADARAAAAAAPRAEQAADRFHPRANARAAVEQVPVRRPVGVRAAPADPPPVGPEPPPAPPPEPPYRQRGRAAAEGRRQQRHGRWEEVRRLRGTGPGRRRCPEGEPGGHRPVPAGRARPGRAGRTAPSRLDPFRVYPGERRAAARRNARVLHRELRERGYCGGYDQVRRAARRRAGAGGRPGHRGPPRPPAPAVPPPRRLSFVVGRRPGRRTDRERAPVGRLGGASGTAAAAVDSGERFAAVARGRSAGGPGEWPAAAAAGGVTEFRGLARPAGPDLAARPGWGIRGVIERPGGRAGEPAEAGRASRVRAGRVRVAAGAGAERGVASGGRTSGQPRDVGRPHQKCGRPLGQDRLGVPVEGADQVGAGDRPGPRPAQALAADDDDRAGAVGLEPPPQAASSASASSAA